MKRLLVLFLIIAILLPGILSGTESGKKMFVEFQGNMVFPSDGNFKDIYGTSAIYIRGKSGYKIIGDLYLFFGCGVLNITGETPILKEEAKAKQKICIFGAGYEGSISKKISYRLEGGGSNFSYTEEALDEKVTGSKLGIMVNGSIVFDFSDRFYADFSVGYIGASDSVEGVGIKLGGIHTALGIGIRI